MHRIPDCQNLYVTTASMSSAKHQDFQEPSDKADLIIKENVQRKWKSYLWDTFDKSSEERIFLFKLDFALLTFASLGTATLFLPSMGQTS